MRSNPLTWPVPVQLSPEMEIFIKEVKLDGDLVLAPMDGITDQPFRSLIRGLGSAMCVTEFINALDVIKEKPDLEKKLSFLDKDRPVFVQLFDDDPDRLVEAALRIYDRVQPDGFDINMGCPSKSVSSRGAGAALLKSPWVIAKIFDRMTKNLHVPITGKIRLGWDSKSLNFLETASIIEDNGGAMVTVHGRTKEQGYTGSADWDAIAEVKQKLEIPVFGNGDVCTVADISRIKDHTRCDAIMIGRAALENPWIFQYKDRSQVSANIIYDFVLEHLSASYQFYGDRGVILFRKFIKTYLTPFKIPKSRISKLMVITSYPDLVVKLKELFTDFQGLIPRINRVL